VDWSVDVNGPHVGGKDTTGHSTLQHQADFYPYGGCTYSGNAGVCYVQVTAEPNATVDDLGVLVNPLYPHEATWGGQLGSANGESPQSATSVTAAGVESCLSGWCVKGLGVSVSYPPVTISYSPTSALWGTQDVWTNSCPKETPILCSKNRDGDKKNPPQQICKCIPHGCCSTDCGPSPIVIDTLGKGFHISGPENCVKFDIKANGKPECVSWPEAGSGNGWLALDRNHNGKIDSGAELFGNHTDQQASKDPNGYIALGEFDKVENGGWVDHKGQLDGVISHKDKIFKDLVVWIDDNPRDGITQPSELHHLKELGICGLLYNADRTSREDEHGNEFRYTAKVIPCNPGDHVDRKSFDVFLVVDKK
jgi:hypothetical protein